jgi:fructose-1-phosphate kinase PfkB-like protein
VVSGSLPPGVSDAFYRQVAEKARRRGSKVIVDSHGEPLLRALDAHPFLIKPNLRNFADAMMSSTSLYRNH